MRCYIGLFILHNSTTLLLSALQVFSDFGTYCRSYMCSDKNAIRIWNTSLKVILLISRRFSLQNSEVNRSGRRSFRLGRRHLSHLLVLLLLPFIQISDCKEGTCLQMYKNISIEWFWFQFKTTVIITLFVTPLLQLQLFQLRPIHPAMSTCPSLWHQVHQRCPTRVRRQLPPSLLWATPCNRFIQQTIS